MVLKGFFTHKLYSREQEKLDTQLYVCYILITHHFDLVACRYQNSFISDSRTLLVCRWFLSLIFVCLGDETEFLWNMRSIHEDVCQMIEAPLHICNFRAQKTFRSDQMANDRFSRSIFFFSCSHTKSNIACSFDRKKIVWNVLIWFHLHRWNMDLVLQKMISIITFLRDM